MISFFFSNLFLKKLETIFEFSNLKNRKTYLRIIHSCNIIIKYYMSYVRV